MSFEFLRAQQVSITQQSEVSAFYTVVRWHKLGEVDNECTSHSFIVLAIRLPKISKFGGDLTKFWQKQVGTFFWTTLFILGYCNVWRLYRLAWHCVMHMHCICDSSSSYLDIFWHFVVSLFLFICYAKGSKNTYRVAQKIKLLHFVHICAVYWSNFIIFFTSGLCKKFAIQ